ncbi:methyl-accepting chemotaxis protein [Halobaculum sp. D14]|uniref:methyl-accepting chemotaxis protein n=1 Tax=unclassified Halobaculum TaxID=2640896 RepID=UPI003EBD92E0
MRTWLRRLGEKLVGSQTDPVPDGGVTVQDSSDPAEMPTAEEKSEELNVDDDLLLDGVGSPVFMIDADGEIVAWNNPIEDLTGVSADDAVGHEHASEMFYPDGRRAKTLADKVLEAPQTADKEFGVSVEDREQNLYCDESVMTDRHGEDRHIYFTAMPLYEDGDVVAVIETVRDRTEQQRRQEAVESLVTELQSTMQSLMDGELSARADFDHENDLLDDRLLTVVEEVNDLGREFQEMTRGVDDRTEHLRESVDEAVDAAGDISENVGEQNELLTEAVSEMQTFSASMEEVAATAEEVDTAADQARDAANEGLDASEDAREATEEVTEIGEELVESVTDLGDRMDDIEAVVEVISDVAEQTNLLALNANIEAARAGKDGDGFAVVAEEVKTLADETRQHTEQITGNISELQNQTDSTVVAAEQSHQQIDHAADQIDDVLEAFEDIAASIDQAADGITEVSRATDDQAATVEELTATIEDVRDRSGETEAAADRIVAATDEQTEAIDALSDRVRELRGRDSGVQTDGGVNRGESPFRTDGGIARRSGVEADSEPDDGAGGVADSDTGGFEFGADR